MAVEIYWVMLLMGWAIAIWAIGVLSVITVLYWCRSGNVSMVRTWPLREPLLTGQARTKPARAAPAQPDIPSSPESEDSHVGVTKRRKQVPFETVYFTKAQRVFHTHACGRNRDFEDMSKLEMCKICRGQLLR